MSVSVVGLDISLTSTGIATQAGLSSMGSAGKAQNTLQDDIARLRASSLKVMSTILSQKPLLVCVEGPALGTHKGGRDHLLAGFWWTLAQCLGQSGIATCVVPPSSLKKYITGAGNAGKDKVLKAVTRRLPQYDPADDDQADALVLYAMGMDWLGCPIVEVPEAHRLSLLACSWPAIPQLGKEAYVSQKKSSKKPRSRVAGEA